ncbi:polysaccharide biosynthesis tyrosine autokinase [Lutibacter sp. A80]|uniref:GumC family protein n=1 Tax=Lutibacter sp. A80 TaxID=2918453 RepID=UPI001F06474E|nr:polysaccharide biosynthesis tyrosine autokinase [Lutibacter sp. A80]UMB60804.1 polysaccharide biosynthesis tyrosine autokinase [Lutibacter sp. A80]
MQDKKNFDFVYLDDDDDIINFREVFEKYLAYYKWFIVGGVVALFVAFIYLRYTPKQYEVSSTILIDDENNGGMSSELSAFEDLGVFGGSKSNLDNEIGILRSRSLMERVVKDLKLNISYRYKGNVRDVELYGDAVPFKINFFIKDSTLYQLDTVFNIKKLTNTSFKLISAEGQESKTHNFGERVTTDFGAFTVTPKNTTNAYLDEEIIVAIAPLENVVDSYRGRVNIAANDKKSSLVNLTMQDGINKKAREIIDYLVEQYNKAAIEDKSAVAKNTDVFINDRLEVISKDLSLVDKGVEEFKTDNKLTDITTESGLILNTNNSIEQKIVELNTQLKLADYVASYVNSNDKELIPANLGLADENTNQNTMQYNELLLEYNRILNSSGKLNPILLNLEEQLSKLRASIQQSLVNLKSSLNISLKDAQRQEYRLNSKITSVPKQEREYRDIQRQQQIIETLYLYLLEKREENAISLAATTPNAKIIDKAYGSKIPVSPKTKIVYLAALLLGFLIPFVIIYLIFLFDNKVHTFEDVEAVFKAPILGEIPESKPGEAPVVQETQRDGKAEAFRLLRTNVNFMLADTKEASKVVFVTSTVAGEGKTTVAINLAEVLALSNKKVLVIGADIRKPKLAEYLKIPDKKGLSHFLMLSSLKVKDIIYKVETTNFDLIHSGIIAPNPAELLMNGRFEEILEYGKTHYDYVIVDTAPVGVVTDTLLLSKNNADLFIYVVRANYLDKRLLKIPKKLNKEKRLPNMALVMNGADPKQGYGYGYGYGYGEDDSKKSIWKGIFKK